ncbi:MAG TPA: hypothetical protein PLD59_16885, partial [Tepidisphaeraceae bacterium]|nr:hypothetical protein [Tepidisphaeraceae bacterium]
SPQERANLSGGAWIGIDGRREQPVFAEYRFKTAQAGTFQIFARKFWKHGPFRWQIDDGEVRTVDKTVALLDRVELRKNVEANWVGLGSIDLSPGEHTLRIELADNSGPAAFDCFVITSRPFTPRGLLRPGEKLNRAPDGWFAFEPDDDTFEPSSIDLRFLNEAFAGEKGRLIARGEKLIHESTGETIRFWGANARPDVAGLDRATLDRLAKTLAKRGVNLVRVHMPAGDQHGPDVKAIERIQNFTAAMKSQGIYTAISIYFPLWIKLANEDGYGDYNSGHPFGLVFFDEQFQRVYRSWFKELLTRHNPHGQPLGIDPAVAIVEMVNEDSLFFHTFKPYDRVPAAAMAKLQAQFFNWLVEEYGTVDSARKKWPAGAVRGDDFAAGRVGVLSAYDIAQRKDARAQDTAAFLAFKQQSFFESTQAFLRNDCGYNGLTVASNWVTADARVLGPLDKFSNTVADVMDHHGYYEGKHQGPRASFAIDRGDRYFDRSATRFDRQEPTGEAGKYSFNTPFFDFQYNGKPSVVSEVNWPHPNRFSAEMPLLAAAYGSLQGTDGFMFFTLLSPGWDSTPAKFCLQTPTGLGQFPAAALAYRRGMIRQSEPIAQISLSPEHIRALKGMPANTAGNLDALRAADIPAGATVVVDALEQLDPRAPAAGRVEVTIAPDAGASRIADLSTLIDAEARTIRSVTNELNWNYGKGIVTIDTPRVQAACGFVSANGPVALSDVTIDLKNEFAAVWLVSLDDAPIATSNKILLQVMTEQKNYGYETTGEKQKTIVSLGEPPIVVKMIEGSVTLRPAPQRVQALDINGRVSAPVPHNGGVISLSRDVMYYLIER